jgi:hypothetical protein
LISWHKENNNRIGVLLMQLGTRTDKGLFDVGQEEGFGPGQTDWIARLPGTDAPGARD